MKKFLCSLSAIIVILTLFGACGAEQPINLENHMTQTELDSVVWRGLSSEHIFYAELSGIAEQIQEISVYDQELDTTYIIHLVLPPNYDENKSYPVYLLMDGLWRILDVAALLPMISEGKIEDIIFATVGYDYGTESEVPRLRQRDLTQKHELFLDFVTENLMPLLGEHYNIDYRRSALEGHSFGGVFVYYAVFAHDIYANDPFGYYVMSSPTLMVTSSYIEWRLPDNWRVCRDIEAEYWSRNKKLDKDIYVSAGKADSDIFMLPDIDDFMARMKKHRVRTIEYTLYDGDHSSFVPEMLRDSLLRYYGINS